mgnify:FL=1|jgi:ABC transporter, permease protein
MEKIRWKMRRKSERVVLTLVFIVFAIYAVTLMIPFVWAFISSLKTDDEYYERVFAWPRDWLFGNYIRAFKEFTVNGVSFLGMFANSLWLTVAGTFISIMVTSMTAYTVAKYDFRGNKFIYRLAIFIMVIPIVGNLPAQYKLIMDLGINNPIGILLLYTGGFGMNFIILHGTYRSISWTYAEAAFIDGGSDWTVYWRIMLPQAMPSLIALSVLSCIGIWNDYMTPFLYLKNSPTLALGIYQFDVMQQYRSNVPIYYCGVLLSMLPILILFVCMQKTIMTNTVAGGLKG